MRTCAILMSICLTGACTADGDVEHGHETEVITTVTLTFTPENGDDAITAAFSDPDGDGGASGTSEPVTLNRDTTYRLDIAFANALVQPAQDITMEIAEEAEEHQVFVWGTGLRTVATLAYDDKESDYGANLEGDDLPVGLRQRLTTHAAGQADLRVMLRHLPVFNGVPQKTPDLVAGARDMPGEADVDVLFALTVG